MDIITRPPCWEQPSGKLYLNTNQLDLVNNIWTVVELNSLTAGFTDGIEDPTNHRITPGVAGFYDVKGQMWFMNVIADKRYLVKILKNAATNVVTGCLQASIAEYLCVACAAHVYLSATDYLELMAQSRAGVDTVDILAGVEFTHLSVQRVR